jgi:hypothetical protein
MNDRRRSYRGCNLLVARKIWKKRLGGFVGDKDGTGEEIYRHPLMPKTITVDKRRKDSPLELTHWIDRLIKTLEA